VQAAFVEHDAFQCEYCTPGQPQQAIVSTRTWMAAHTSPESAVYSGLGHDVAGREVTDFTAFPPWQAGSGRHPGQQRRPAATGTTLGNEGVSPAHWPPDTGAEPFTARLIRREP
jgi:hypothetical protein